MFCGTPGGCLGTYVSDKQGSRVHAARLMMQVMQGTRLWLSSNAAAAAAAAGQSWRRALHHRQHEAGQVAGHSLCTLNASEQLLASTTRQCSQPAGSKCTKLSVGCRPQGCSVTVVRLTSCTSMLCTCGLPTAALLRKALWPCAAAAGEPHAHSTLVQPVIGPARQCCLGLGEPCTGSTSVHPPPCRSLRGSHAPPHHQTACDVAVPDTHDLQPAHVAAMVSCTRTPAAD